MMQQANDPLSRNKLPWDEDEDEYLCRIFLEEVSVDKMSKVRDRPPHSAVVDSSPLLEPDANNSNCLLQQLMYRSNTSITQRKKNLKKDGKWDKLEAAIVQAES